MSVRTVCTWSCWSKRTQQQKSRDAIYRSPNQLRDAHLDFEVKSKLKIRNNESNKAHRWCLGMCPTLIHSTHQLCRNCIVSQTITLKATSVIIIKGHKVFICVWRGERWTKWEMRNRVETGKWPHDNGSLYLIMMWFLPQCSHAQCHSVH